MAPSRRTASGVVQFIRDVSQRGPVEALRVFNLETLADRPAADVFLALVDVLCPAGGPIDEAIARQALIETIAELSSTTDSLAAMTPDQWKEFLIGFVSRSIEGRIAQEVGTKMISLPDDVAAVTAIEGQLHDFVTRCVTDAFENPDKPLTQFTDQEVNAMVDRLYETTFGVFEALTDTE